jgi:hypothetical protein
MPGWAAGCGPDFRIVSDGRRYRVERRVSKGRRPVLNPSTGDVLQYAGKDEWEPVTDPDWGAHLGRVPAPMGGWPPIVFETRWLWLAKRRLAREQRKAAPKREQAWSVVWHGGEIGA